MNTDLKGSQTGLENVFDNTSYYSEARQSHQQTAGVGASVASDANAQQRTKILLTPNKGPRKGFNCDVTLIFIFTL